MMDSQNLLAEYLRTGSDAAFRELVTRYVDLVYSTALRLVGGDTHRAEDVAQTVFLDLARAARALPIDVKLGGWLHRDTCFVAANVLRGERRRQSRERQAVEMNALEQNPDADMAHVAPLLDEAINELGEADRKAIVLRFFEQQDFRALGQALGSSEDAARMRVGRALDKLRDLLKRRGLTTSAASLAVILSAQAIQAAPAGLIASISTAVAVAGTGLAATATVATKTIAMTTLQKTLIGATLALALGAGIFQTYQSSRLGRENRRLQQQQGALTERVQQLQSERETTTNQMAVLNQENARLKSESNATELLKLRSETGRLRQQLAALEAKSGPFPTGFAKMLNDPAMRDYLQQTQLNLLRARFGQLFKELKLTPEQSETVVGLMGTVMMKNTDKMYALPQGSLSASDAARATAELWTEMKQQLLPMLGEAGCARLKEYREEFPAHATVDLTNGKLGVNQLSDEQGQKLLQVVKAEPFDLTRGVSGDWDMAFWGPQSDIDSHLAKVAESNQRVIQKAADFLTPEQLTALTSVLTNAVSERISQATAFIQRH